MQIFDLPSNIKYQCNLLKSTFLLSPEEIIMYEIIANPEHYKLDDLIKGTGNAKIDFSADERQKWADEIEDFGKRLIEFAEKSKTFSKVLSGSEKITATPASLKTLKIQLFAINDALNNAMEIAEKLQSDIVSKK